MENGASVVKLVEVEPRCVQERAPILDRHMEVNNALETARRSGSVTLVHVQYQMVGQSFLNHHFEDNNIYSIRLIGGKRSVYRGENLVVVIL